MHKKTIGLQEAGDRDRKRPDPETQETDNLNIAMTVEQDMQVQHPGRLIGLQVSGDRLQPRKEHHTMLSGRKRSGIWQTPIPMCRTR